LIVAQYLNAKAPRDAWKAKQDLSSSRGHRHYRFCHERALTFFNIGWRNDFVVRWWSAFAIGWRIAARTAYLAILFARSLTQRIVAAIERT
jgi:hypothetical protein